MEEIEEIKKVIEERGFSVVTVSESTLDNTINFTINAVNHNTYGGTLAQAKYLDDIENVGHWDENGDKIRWHSHAQIHRCSKSAISLLIDCAKKYKDIDFNFIINNVD